MQQQSLQASSTGATGLPFDTVAPKLTCTRQVAAAAFYHCLGEPILVLWFREARHLLISGCSRRSISHQGPTQSRTTRPAWTHHAAHLLSKYQDGE